MKRVSNLTLDFISNLSDGSHLLLIQGEYIKIYHGKNGEINIDFSALSQEAGTRPFSRSRKKSWISRKRLSPPELAATIPRASGGMSH
jgi:hypothetical protein